MSADTDMQRLGWRKYSSPIDAADNQAIARAKSLLVGIDMQDGRPYVDDLTPAQARDVLRYFGETVP